jgi:tRNA G26 N,N-dimethylase Trm1
MRLVLQLAGPMWLGKLHDQEFISRVLEDVEMQSNQYGTFARMKGMLTLAKDVRDIDVAFSAICTGCQQADSLTIGFTGTSRRVVLLHSCQDR